LSRNTGLNEKAPSETTRDILSEMNRWVRYSPFFKYIFFPISFGFGKSKVNFSVP
jgi:hypothetical protein